RVLFRSMVVQSREDPIASMLVKRLQQSPSLALLGGASWSDAELTAHLAARRPIDAHVVTLVCPAARNEELSQALLAQHPGVVVVRIDTDGGRVPRHQAVKVDLVEHLGLDQKRFGFDRLLNAMVYLAEHHSTGSADRLVRYLVLDDDSSLTGEGVRFIEVGAAMRGRPQARQLPAPAYAWLDET